MNDGHIGERSAPEVDEERGALLDEVAVVHVILRGETVDCGGSSAIAPTDDLVSDEEEEGDARVLMGGRKRATSAMIASMNGRSFRSDMTGRRSEPTTRSISSCARRCASGCLAMRSMKDMRRDEVCVRAASALW